MQNKKIVIIIILIICILILIPTTIFIENKIKLKDHTSGLTTKITTTTTPQTNPNILEIDYAKEFNTYNIDIGLSDFKDINLIKNDNNILKQIGNKVEFKDNNINYYGSDANKILLTFKTNQKVLYNLSDIGTQYLITFIVYDDNNAIKIYKLLSAEDNYVEKTITSSSKEIGVNWKLTSNKIDFSDIYLKNETGGYSKVNDNTIIYSKNTLENVIWYKEDIIINKEKEVYYRGKKVDDLKFLAVILEDDVDGLFVNGLISSDNYYYIFTKQNIEKKKIQNIITKPSDIKLDDVANVSVELQFTDGNTLNHESSLYISKINYYKNL